MAEFSKEYCEKYDMGFEGDFSITEIFDTLEDDHFMPIICEGYGFLGILKQENKCRLMFSVEGNPINSIELPLFEDLDDYYKKRKSKWKEFC